MAEERIKFTGERGPQTLTDQQIAVIENWIREKWTADKRCPVCGTENWEVSDYLGEIRTQTLINNPLFGGSSFPLVVIVCINCGNTRFINAIIARVVTLPAAPTPPTPEPPKP